jgi:hypothetical protein
VAASSRSAESDPDAALADAWINLVESGTGREALSSAGFRVP